MIQNNKLVRKIPANVATVPVRESAEEIFACYVKA